MEKKFLDKQGLTKMLKHLKDKYVNKVDNEQTVKTVQSLDLKRQTQEMGEKIVQDTTHDVQNLKLIDCMVFTGQYRIKRSQVSNISPQPVAQRNDLDEVWNKKVKQGFVNLSNELLLIVTKSENDGKYTIVQTVEDPILGIIFTRYSKTESAQYSDEYLLNSIKTENNKWSVLNLIKTKDWSAWEEDIGSHNQHLTEFIATSNSQYLQPAGLLSLHDKKKLDRFDPSLFSTKVDKVQGKDLSSNDYTSVDKNKLQAMPIPTFLEKEQYESLSEQKKMDKTKLYYIYVERQQ